jgi:competence protein ComEC
MQSRAIHKLDCHAEDSASHATVVAMVAGARHDMPKQLRAAYSTTGLSHLMAVSGLHLGIVLMVVGFLLVPLYFVHGGHRLAMLLSIVAIWVYAIMSGASPSVVRAAIMFTVLLLANVVSANYNSVNVLATTVFAMLVYRPGYLFDVSFQLSVAAVFGIVVWCAPLVRSVRSWSRGLSRFAAPFIVGAVATLWTLPIVSHTFGNLPLAGVVITPVVLIFAYAVVGCGLLALVLPGVVALPFAWLGEWCAWLQNGVVLWAAERGITGVEYRMTTGEVAVWYAVVGVITIVAWSVNRKKVITLS